MSPFMLLVLDPDTPGEETLPTGLAVCDGYELEHPRFLDR